MKVMSEGAGSDDDWERSDGREKGRGKNDKKNTDPIMAKPLSVLPMCTIMCKI